jgi:hypothetical protein
MSGVIVAVIVIVVIVVLAALVATAASARRRRLQQQFGPEYDRVVTEQSSRLRAEAELTDRQRRVRKLDIKPLSEEARRAYAADWMTIQEQFVDSPQTAVRAAYELVTTVMTDRGYPIEDDEQVMADLSVEHAQTVSHFRAAQQITTSAATGEAATEDLRQALIHYRALFSDLLGDPAAVPGTAPADTNPADTNPADTAPADAAVAPAPVTESGVTGPEVVGPEATVPGDTDLNDRIAEPAVRDQADISQR